MRDIDEQDGPMGQGYAGGMAALHSVNSAILSMAALILVFGMAYSRRIWPR